MSKRSQRRGPSRLVISVVAMSAAACGASLYRSMSGPTTLSADEAFHCLQDRLEERGYRQTARDDGDHWFSVQKDNRALAVSATNLRRSYDWLVVTAWSDTAQGHLTIEAHSFNDFDTKRGVTPYEREVSARAQADAVSLLEECSGVAAPQASTGAEGYLPVRPRAGWGLQFQPSG